MIIPGVFFLQENEQLLISGFTQRWILNGPGTYFTPPLHSVIVRKAILLGPTNYLRIRDILTGELHNEVGPKLYFLDAYEEVVEEYLAIALKKNQYIKLIDKSRGIIRVERGEKIVYLGPTEAIYQQIQDGINIDETNAVLVRNIETGRLNLVTEPQVFIPAANEEIIDNRDRITLENHEVVVIKDKTGKYIFKRGTEQERAFFLDPHAQLVRFRWSSGIHKEKRDIILTHIDTRPKFMWYEFEVRTQDNVELVVGITFFWQIIDVEAMVRATDDTPGDICSHARSAIIQSVSQVVLERFLSAFNAIVRQAILESNDNFYAERGVKLHAVEVRSVTCKDPATQHILQEIIQETTDRLNRLQKQASQNEVKLQHMKGEIEAEELRGQLLQLQREHTRLEGMMQGEGEGDRVHAFLDGLGQEITVGEKIVIFNTLRKQDMLKDLSKGNAHLYFTPADVDLRIETTQNSGKK